MFYSPFFNRTREVGFVKCIIAIELADEHAARAYAVKVVQELAAETALHGHLIRHHRVEYLDAAHNPLGEVRSDGAVEISP